MSLENKLRRRLIISLSVAVSFCIIVVASFFWIQSSKVDEAYTIHRQAFILNEKVWRMLQSAKTESVAKNPPPLGKVPRVNGLLGLKSALNVTNYKIIIESDEKKVSLTPADFYLLPKVGYTTDFRCIEGWSEVMQYGGARFSDFMEAYKLGKKADGTYFKYVGLETPDKKYYVSIDMESMLHPQTLLAYEMNLAPLKPENGLPLRLIIPIKYGIKSLKRVGRIFFSDQRPPDYWAERGYDWYSGL
ncbi:MAG: molybdopterin-dependent oxidoreductase [Bdellovibrionales bacterium]|nr:molybdopterin-dependent oxidoreductase [Bdellovibrionales bacterium]